MTRHALNRAPIEAWKSTRTPFTAQMETARFVVRTVTPDDAHARWCAWLDDPAAAAMLNTPRRTLSLADLRRYIARYDQVSRIMMGIFSRDSGQQIGFATGEYSDNGLLIMPSVLIGEPEWRHIGVVTELLATLRDFLFQNLQFDAVISQVLAHNEPVIRLLESRGWTLLQRLPNEKKRADGQGHYDMLIYQFTRETWAEQTRAAGG